MRWFGCSRRSHGWGSHRYLPGGLDAPPIALLRQSVSEYSLSSLQVKGSLDKHESTLRQQIILFSLRIAPLWRIGH